MNFKGLNMLVGIIDTITEVTGKLAAWAFFGIALAVTFEVVVRADVVRDLFGTAPTKWVDEISRITQIWATFLAAAFVLKHRQWSSSTSPSRTPTPWPGA